jgi:hypothetical protein
VPLAGVRNTAPNFHASAETLPPPCRRASNSQAIANLHIVAAAAGAGAQAEEEAVAEAQTAAPAPPADPALALAAAVAAQAAVAAEVRAAATPVHPIEASRRVDPPHPWMGHLLGPCMASPPAADRCSRCTSSPCQALPRLLVQPRSHQRLASAARTLMRDCVDRRCGGAQPRWLAIWAWLQLQRRAAQLGYLPQQQRRAAQLAYLPLRLDCCPAPQQRRRGLSAAPRVPGSGRRAAQIGPAVALHQRSPSPRPRHGRQRTCRTTTGRPQSPREHASDRVPIVAPRRPTSTAPDVRLVASRSASLLALLPQLQVAHESYPAARLHGWTQPVVLSQPPPDPAGPHRPR